MGRNTFEGDPAVGYSVSFLLVSVNTYFSPESRAELPINKHLNSGDNWAKNHEKWHRTTVCKQLLPEIEKAGPPNH